MPALQGKRRRERGRDDRQALEACAAWKLWRRLKPTLLNGKGRVAHPLNSEVGLRFFGCPTPRGVGEGWGFDSSFL
jgi:hypothetical protein